MKFWNDELRICPKCRAAVRLGDEVEAICAKCSSRVRFYDYRQIPPPRDLPETTPVSIWANPTTTGILIVVGLLVVATLVAIHQTLAVAAILTLVAIGFAVVAFIRHAEARRIEHALENMQQLKSYAETMRSRVQELTERYTHLLRTGDARIEHYYGEIYVQAERERQTADKLRQQAARDRESVRSVESRIYAMAERLVHDHLKWTAAKLRPDPENYQRRRGELTKTFDFVESIGYRLPAGIRTEALTRLKDDYKRIVEVFNLREEQKRIKQQIREEERIRQERETALLEAELRERELQRRLDEAIRRHRGVYDAEVEELKRLLADAQAKSERAKSMAELTKAGHVYVLSNIGSFGEGVFKVGMTRRIEPLLRVKELGDASVPFPFDVHVMISCDNAPALECALHRHLTRYRVNRVNLRKEYFQVDLSIIMDVVRQHHGHIEYIAQPEALEYRESLTISPDELVQVESELAELGIVFEEFEE